VKVLAPSSFDEMVLAFLRGELDSPRFGDAVRGGLEARRMDERLINAPNLDDEMENGLRASILREYRPWLADSDVLGAWPPNATWQWVELPRTEVEELHYIPYDYWDALSGGTHLVRDGARCVREGTVIFDVPNDRFWEVARTIDAGETLLPLIIFSVAGDGVCTLIEGHLRATGYLLAQRAPATVRAVHATVSAGATAPGATAP
jgi:hypothetical protein